MATFSIAQSNNAGETVCGLSFRVFFFPLSFGGETYVCLFGCLVVALPDHSPFFPSPRSASLGSAAGPRSSIWHGLFVDFVYLPWLSRGLRQSPHRLHHLHGDPLRCFHRPFCNLLWLLLGMSWNLLWLHVGMSWNMLWLPFGMSWTTSQLSLGMYWDILWLSLGMSWNMLWLLLNMSSNLWRPLSVCWRFMYS